MAFPTIQHIKYEKCPVCEAEIREVAVHDLHTNGDWNEKVRFGCGCTYTYSPNFRRVLLQAPCGNAHERCLALQKAPKTL